MNNQPRIYSGAAKNGGVTVCLVDFLSEEDAPLFNKLDAADRLTVINQVLGRVAPQQPKPLLETSSVGNANKTNKPRAQASDAAAPRYTAAQVAHMHKLVDAACDRRLARQSGDDEDFFEEEPEPLPASDTPGRANDRVMWLSDAQRFERDARACME